MSVSREEYVRIVTTRAIELTNPAPREYWQDGRAWVRLNHGTFNLGTNEAVEDFLAGKIGKEEFDRHMKAWLDLWRQDRQLHQQGIPL